MPAFAGVWEDRFPPSAGFRKVRSPASASDGNGRPGGARSGRQQFSRKSTLEVPQQLDAVAALLGQHLASTLASTTGGL